VRYKLCRCGGVKEDTKGGKCNRCSGGAKVGNDKTTASKGYGNDWRLLSERYRKQNPLCVECEKRGIATAAEEVHHIVPIEEAPWLRLEVKNLMALCVACHRAIDEARRRGQEAGTRGGW